MIIHIATPELVVLETKSCEQSGENVRQGMVRSVLEEGGLEQWSSIEIEEYTYRDAQLLFAAPIKIFIPSFLAALLN
ncbi:MAG: hypothetical protein EOM51_05360 [Clostridia bacterium]|nr:hypothetical protein [Clostridia bacterium]